MIRKPSLAAALVLLALASASAGGQGGQGGQERVMTVRPESRVRLDGSSNVADWACRSEAFEATVAVDTAVARVPAALTRPVRRVSVRIPVRSLKCGNRRMNEDLYRTLRAAEFPDIQYVLAGYRVNPVLTMPGRFAATTWGDITVAGVTRRVEVPVTADRREGGARGMGRVRLRMTDFGVKPPTAFLGAIRTRNEIEVSFEVLLDRTALVALSGTRVALVPTEAGSGQ